MSWYPVYLLVLALLWLCSTERDRSALRVILVAGIASTTVVHLIMQQIVGAWKLAIPGAVELLTILALLHWSRGRPHLIQVILLLIAWLCHVLCFADIQLGTDLVYDNYETILALVALGQILAFHDTIAHMLSAIRGFCRDVRGYCVGGVSPASGGMDVSRLLRDPDSVQVEPPTFQ